MNTSPNNDSKLENQDDQDQTVSDSVEESTAELADEVELVIEDETESQSDELIDHLKQELAVQKNLYFRALADLENLKKRNLMELDKARKYAIDQFAREMVDVLDSLEKACEAKEQVSDDAEIDSAQEGVGMIRRQMLNTFEKFSISEIDPKPGDAFNPDEQHAISMLPSSDIPANHVAIRFRKGYRIHDRLLRPAMVIVATEMAPKKNEETNKTDGS